MIEWLLDIDRLDLSDPMVSFGWAYAVPGWGWALIALGALGLAWMTYRRLQGNTFGRLVLGSARALLIALIVVILAGPQFTRPNERIEQDWVIVLADRSASMTIGDGPNGETREQALRRALETASPEIAELAANRRVLSLGFDSGVFAIDPSTASENGLGEADGRRTFLGASLDLALDQVAARPVAGVILLSDGASADDVSRRAMRRLRSERIPVFTVPLGSADPAVDLSITRVVAPAAGFVGDRVPVTVTIDRSRTDAAGGGWVELIDTRTDRVLDRSRSDPSDDNTNSTEVTLVAQPDLAGDAAWIVRLSPDGGDLLSDNNTAEVAVNLVDRPLRIMQIDGYPRWEFRFLKNLLLRESSIVSTSFMLATGRRHIQEGDLLVSRVPVSPAEWEEFDVVLLGDFRADLMSTEQLEQLRDHIAERGAGLLWIAGPGATPGSWRDTPLEALLPMTLEGSPTEWNEAVTMTRSDEADRFGLLELDDEATGGWPERLTSPETGWSLLRWAQLIDPAQLKPTTRVLAEFAAASDPTATTPAVMTMRYGAGRVIYVATDEIWRWRYARGEALPERFWIPLIRMLGREGLARMGQAAVLEVGPRNAELGVPVAIDLTLLDARLVAAAPSSLRARVLNEDNESVTELELRPDSGGEEPRRFASLWTAPAPGVYQIVAEDPVFGADRPTAELTVFATDDERRRPETDHARLISLAQETGGEAVSPDDLAEVPARLPNRERRISGLPDVETLWDTPLALLLLVVLLSTEWIGRRLMRMT